MRRFFSHLIHKISHKISHKKTRWAATHPNYPLWSRALEIFAIVAFSFMAFSLAQSITIWLVDSQSLIQIVKAIGLIIIAFLAADFVSGLVHFLCDSFGSGKTRLLGPIIIRHFLSHHDEPNDISAHDFIETNGNNFLACTLLLLPFYLLQIIFGLSHIGLFNLFWLSLCCFLAMTNQSHKWAHKQKNSPQVSYLQKIGVLLPQTDHALHHQAPFNKNYCITSGILNRPLARIGFFPKLYRLIAKNPVRPGPNQGII